MADFIGCYGGFYRESIGGVANSYGRSMAEAWPKHGNFIAEAPPKHGAIMARPGGKFIDKSSNLSKIVKFVDILLQNY